MATKTDAIVVGLGASGAIIAEQLAAAGWKVVGLDKGPHYAEDDFRFKHDEIRYYVRSAIVPHMGTDPITWRPDEDHQAAILPWASGRLGLGDPFQIPPSIGTGGGTNHWGGAVFRFREADFRMRSAIVERFGAGAVPEDTTLEDWPVGYKDLEPYYDRVEWEIGISGQAGNVGGEIVEGGNPFEAPRGRGYPMPSLRQGAADLGFVAACKQLGYHPFPIPAAIASVDYQGRSACVYCGFCHGFPCHVGAKSSTHVTCIARGLATGNFEIRPFARVFRVNRDATGRRVVGVSYFDSDGNAQDIEAPTVIIAAYALENARLLLASGIDGGGQVGRHLMIHNYGWYTALLPEPTNPFMGPLVGASVIDDVASELVPDNDEGVLWGSPVTSWTGDTQPIEVAHNLPAGVPRWGKEFKDWLRQNYRRLYKMYSQTATFPSRRYYCDLDPDVKDEFGQPALRLTHDWVDHDRKAVEFMMKIKRAIGQEMGVVQAWEDPPAPPYHVTTHDVGTHRMGLDPAASVVDPFGEAHSCRGLYAVGGGQFPTLAPYNPTETIQALAYLTADHLLGRM